MRFADGVRRSDLGARRTGAAIALGLLTLASVRADSPILVHGQRYAMGTMFDIVVYHASRGRAERAIDRALDEIVRLDHVLSHFEPDNDLARLVRDARHQSVAVDASLYDVLQQSLTISRLSDGTFDVTIAPLLKAWRRAREEGREPTPAEISAARRCVGFDKIDASQPGQIRVLSDCVDIDLGGIGKGYAVDRALGMLKEAGILDAVVNGGSSSIGAIGVPPGGNGWRVKLGQSRGPDRTMALRDAAMSTSEQNGEILDPRDGVPEDSPFTVTVIGHRAATADALSTTLVLLSIEDGKALLTKFPDVSALWMSPEGHIRAQHGACGRGEPLREVPPCR
jgi:thiamine biosynthesis lipoprotein